MRYIEVYILLIIIPLFIGGCSLLSTCPSAPAEVTGLWKGDLQPNNSGDSFAPYPLTLELEQEDHHLMGQVVSPITWGVQAIGSGMIVPQRCAIAFTVQFYPPDARVAINFLGHVSRDGRRIKGTYISESWVGPDGTESRKDSGHWEVTRRISSENIPPVAALKASPLEGPAPLKITLDGSQSYDPDGVIILYTWELDGPISTRQLWLQPSFNFELLTPGTYKVTLIVMDDNGATAKSPAITVIVT
jgi:hypothetical protein